jgi:outer membrane murein-binding lipoprotein Lpp
MFAVATMLLSGCGTTAGYNQADKTGKGIAEFRESIVNGKKAIDETVQALDQIAATANSNPRKAFEQYSKSLANLESAAAEAIKRAEEMRAKGQEYFKQWEQQLAQVQNPEIRAMAQQQRAKLQSSFDSIKQYAQPLKAQFQPWLSDLRDLRTYLSNDLTTSGVDAAKSLFAKTRTEGIEVQKSMDALVAELNTVAATLTPAKTAS